MNFSPQPNKISSIGIWGTVMDGPANGYGYAGLKMVQAINRMGIKTYWQDVDAPLSISFCQPDMYSQEKDQIKVAYTPWESTKIPDHWIPIINTMDCFWTTSSFCADVFKSEGVEIPIRVVHHGLDKKEWRLKKREVKGTFTFLHVGEPATRKNGQMVADAFLDRFEGNMDYKLIMKANEYSVARRRNPFGSLEGHPQIELITKKYSQFSLELLFHKSHCMVYPSSGEGFGLIPFQAIATGMPTLLVDWGGISDFGRYGYPIDYKVGPSNHGWHLGDWAWPDLKDLGDKMEWVAENYDKISERSFHNGIELTKSFDWDNILKKALSEFI